MRFLRRSLKLTSDPFKVGSSVATTRGRRAGSVWAAVAAWIEHRLSVGLLLTLTAASASACVAATASTGASPEEPVGAPGDAPVEPGTDMQVFLLFGQSNMEGAAAAEAADQVIHERVFVLGCDDGCLGRAFNTWAPAQPPLHRCFAGLGPGDWFGKTMAAAWSQAQIGLVPAAISGVDIDFFRKDVVSERCKEFEVPPDDQRPGAYEMLVERAKLTQRRGRIRGILFHQGESDTGQNVWLDKVAEIVAKLREDLALAPEEVPFLAGELPYGGCCSAHNSIVNCQAVSPTCTSSRHKAWA